MIELITHIIDKLDVKRLLISVFVGVLMRLFLPNNFIFNTIIERKVSFEHQEMFGFSFYTLLAYVSTLLISLLIKIIGNALDYQHRIERWHDNEIETINIINSLIYEDKIVLVNLINSNNRKTKAYLGSDFISYLIENRFAVIVPNSHVDAKSKFSYYDTQVEIILNQKYYMMIKSLYDNKKILQNY